MSTTIDTTYGARTAIAFRRAVAAEWTRLWTVRSTWWTLAATTALFAAVAASFIVEPPREDIAGPALPATAGGQLGIAMGEYGLLVIAMLAVTAEHSTGAIRTSLQWTPRRGLFFTARTAVTVATATVLGVLLVLATDVAIWSFTSDDPSIPPLTGRDLLASLGNVATVMLSSAFLTVGLGFALRHSAATLTTVFLLLFVLPASLADTSVDVLRTIGAHLPGSAVVSLLEIAPIVDDARATAILAAWSAAATALGWWAFTRRDA